MLCPCCKSEIIKGDKARFQTSEEHVSIPNATPPLRSTLVCSNSDCITRKHDTFWDWNGDRYGGYDINESEFINSNDAPFGTISRRLNVEIYKKGLKKKKYLSPKWMFNIYQPVLEWNYKSNEDGEVLKKWISISYLKKDEQDGRFCLGVTPFWRTHQFLWHRFKNNIKRYKKNKDSYFLKKAFEPSANRSWPYRAFEKIIQALYPSHYNEYLKLSN